MSAHWPVNDGEDRSGTIPLEGMAGYSGFFISVWYPLKTRNSPKRRREKETNAGLVVAESADRDG